MGRWPLTIEAGHRSSVTFGYLCAHVWFHGYCHSHWPQMIDYANSNTLFVGCYGSGTLTIEAGPQVDSPGGFLGTLRVRGHGHSYWRRLEIGQMFHLFTLVQLAMARHHRTGAQVSDSTGYLGFDSGSMGTVTVTGTGSKWTRSILFFALANQAVARSQSTTGERLHGGTLCGLRSAISTETELLPRRKVPFWMSICVFDAAHGRQATVTFGSDGGSLNVTSAAPGYLGVGYKGNGNLNVTEGVVLTSTAGYVAYYSGSTGTAIVTGAGSKWTNSNALNVGNNGNGTLSIEDRAEVSDSSGFLGYYSGSRGYVHNHWRGSKWTNSNSLYVGYNGSGTLTVEASAK